MLLVNINTITEQGTKNFRANCTGVNLNWYIMAEIRGKGLHNTQIKALPEETLPYTQHVFTRQKKTTIW
jgi:hypothetical protein